MNGLSLLVLTAAYLATVGLSQPLKSAADEETPKDAAAAEDKGGEEAAPAPAAADEDAGAHPAEQKIDEAIQVMNNLNDLFENIVNALQVKPDGEHAEAAADNPADAAPADAPAEHAEEPAESSPSPDTTAAEGKDEKEETTVKPTTESGHTEAAKPDKKTDPAP